MKEIRDIRERQQILHEILKYFKCFCLENDLTFYLSNGTLLGAAKYQGFVPWDDDIDVLMPREDYDKLMRLANINNETYRLMCSAMVPSWHIPYAKLSDTRTYLKEGEFDFGAELGVSLDIFPIDRWHPCKPIASLQALYNDLLKRLLIASIGDQLETKKRGISKQILSLIWALGQRIGTSRLKSIIEKRAMRWARYPKKHSGCVVWTCHRQREVMEASLFEKQTTVWFCGEEYPAPVEYERYLDYLYGEWRKELPADQQHCNHNTRAWWKHA